MINKATRWDKLERVNVESDLLIDFNNQVTLNDQPITSLSFNLEKKTNFGVLFTKGVTSLFVSEIIDLKINSKASIIIQNNIVYINGKNLGVLIKDFSVIGNLIVGNGGISNENFVISHVCYFNDLLTQQEISYIHTQGGLIPESAHESCVAHYPLTQRQYPKASADFIIKHPQFSLNDLVAFDVVEQYNYARVTPLTANHGELINFTDAEAGVDGLAPIGTAIKDFYLKTTLDIYEAPVQPLPINNVEIKSQFEPFINALRFVSTNNHRLEQNVINIDPNADFYTFMVVHKKPQGETYDGFRDMFAYGWDGSSSNRFFLAGRDPIGFQITVVEGGSSKAHIWNDVATATEPSNLQTSFVVVNQNLMMSGDSLAETFFSNGNEIVSSGSFNIAKLRFDLYTQIKFGNNIFGGASQTFNGWVAAFGIWNRALSLKEMKSLTNNTLLMNPNGAIKKGLQQYNLFNNQTANGIEDLSGNGNHIDTFINYSINELDPLNSEYKFKEINELR